MPEWLADAIPSESPISPSVLAVRLLLSLVGGVIVAAVYGVSHGRGKSEKRSLQTTLVLLTILLAIVSMVIGTSVARAFGLVGALSIVRFRAVVDDTRDTAFVIFAVIVGMAIGAGQFLAPAFGIPVISAAAIALSHWRDRKDVVTGLPVELSVRLGLEGLQVSRLEEVVAQHAVRFQIVESSTARQGASLDVVYDVQLKPAETLAGLVLELTRVQGVQSVELRHKKA